jgi:hypothetical protein
MEINGDKSGVTVSLTTLLTVLTYAAMLHHRESSVAACLTLDSQRNVMLWCGVVTILKPEEWIPDPTQYKWFRRAMALVAGQIMWLTPDGSTKPITFGAFDTLATSLPETSNRDFSIARID